MQLLSLIFGLFIKNNRSEATHFCNNIIISCISLLCDFNSGEYSRKEGRVGPKNPLIFQSLQKNSKPSWKISGCAPATIYLKHIPMTYSNLYITHNNPTNFITWSTLQLVLTAFHSPLLCWDKIHPQALKTKDDIWEWHVTN